LPVRFPANYDSRMSRTAALRLGLLALIAGSIAFFYFRERPAEDDGAEPYPVYSVTATRSGSAFRVVDRREPVMGTRFLVEVAAPDEATGRAACRAAYRKIRALESSMSTWIETSALSKLNREAGGDPIRVDPDTLSVLRRARDFWSLSGGAFDPTIGPLLAVWKPLATLEALPTAEAVDSARALVGYDGVEIDATAGTVRLARKGMSIDVGGIAKGYAADMAAREALRAGATACRVNAGGDLVALGAPPWNPEGFPVDVRDPDGGDADSLPGRSFHLIDRGVATSGNYARYTTVVGKRYSHILDPRTGRPVDDAVLQVTVIGTSGTEADALATALAVLGVEEGLRLAEGLPEVEALYLFREDGEIRDAKTSGFPGGAE